MSIAPGVRRGRWCSLFAAGALSLVVAACGGAKAVDPVTAATARGPISIWYSNNAQEVAWGESVVAAWNASHPTETVSAQEIPAGTSSEEVIGAAITAGTTPCLILNTAPADVPDSQKAVGLVALSDFPDGDAYIEARTGDLAAQYKSPDGKYYQLPWKTNPVMVFYNKDVFQKAGIDPDNPPLTTYSDFLKTSEQLVASGAARAAVWPATTSEFFQPWFDFYPLFAAQSNGTQLIENGEPQFADPDGLAVATFWRQMYQENLAPKDTANGDAFGTGQAAMALAGPWAIATYKTLNWGVVPVPTKDGMPPTSIHTYSDEKSIGMYVSCTNRATAWDFAKFATNQDNDGALLQMTGQMPMRTNLATTYPDYFQANPAYVSFADEASRTVDVPNVPNSIQIWQAFRDAYSRSVISGSVPVEQALPQAAEQITQILNRP